MLFRLVLFRLGPWVCLARCKKKRDVKMILLATAAVYLTGFIISVRVLFEQERWRGTLGVLFASFPHYLCYIFAGYLVARCVWNAWSERVWKRIRILAFLLIIIGILFENYLNSRILQFFYNFFK